MNRRIASDWQVFDPKGRRKYLSADERERFLRAADHEADDIRALCYLLTYTGCRISEALALQRHHFEPTLGRVMFRTLKRRKTLFRSVPVPHDVGLMLPHAGHSDACLWPLHRVTAWRHIKAVMDRAGVDGPMATCKGLRHGFGIHAAACGVPQNLIQRWLGHSASTTTAIYVDAVGQEERAFAHMMWRGVVAVH
ncbi:tyrosine-type recombinase/integrase [Stakelama tenebrarum]|uniref:Tyrosine-type recombinase/integrase n=1 Tax=Stakelama tenebrarum TaxID=2711215 RepID=A0A6G6Y4T7_9SPHN|nr:tyrosine-type recombinase/integrase [Sphingosinithalassobacter tenebrarum]QIG79452.1 tyrosine-type recombinase/integrase [Sphingosinithalassobacter tenebrarum]QIG79942.1 tyrosine-type recombinase/integrase [Sphingosinithalassobacter tenebrarum]